MSRCYQSEYVLEQLQNLFILMTAAQYEKLMF